MSQFDRYNTAEYREVLRAFLKELKNDAFVRADLAENGGLLSGNTSHNNTATLAEFENRINAKAGRVEANDTKPGERYILARDYMCFSDAHVAKALGFSLELVRKWRLNISTPSCMSGLAELLNVFLKWLEEGGEHHLVANTHLGGHVGEENLQCREALHRLTQAELADMEDTDDEQYIQAYLEWPVFNQPELATAARLSGRRWQFINNSLSYALWIPIPERGLVRRYWSGEVEAIINEELNTQQSIYAAWEAIRNRCLAKGLCEEDFPVKISLHKRVERERLRTKKFGIDVNSIIPKAVEKFKR